METKDKSQLLSEKDEVLLCLNNFHFDNEKFLNCINYNQWYDIVNIINVNYSSNNTSSYSNSRLIKRYIILFHLNELKKLILDTINTDTFVEYYGLGNNTRYTLELKNFSVIFSFSFANMQTSHHTEKLLLLNRIFYSNTDITNLTNSYTKLINQTLAKINSLESIEKKKEYLYLFKSKFELLFYYLIILSNYNNEIYNKSNHEKLNLYPFVSNIQSALKCSFDEMLNTNQKTNKEKKVKYKANPF
jgi:hypothetical protein